MLTGDKLHMQCLTPLEAAVSHRPYPDTDRALRQVARHTTGTAPHPMFVMDGSTGVIVKWPKAPEGWSEAAAAKAGAPIRALVESVGRVRVSAPALTIGRPSNGSITVGKSSGVEVTGIRPWTPAEYERWQRTGFPPGSGWEPPRTES